MMYAPTTAYMKPNQKRETGVRPRSHGRFDKGFKCPIGLIDPTSHFRVVESLDVVEDI